MRIFPMCLLRFYSYGCILGIWTSLLDGLLNVFSLAQDSQITDALLKSYDHKAYFYLIPKWDENRFSE